MVKREDRKKQITQQRQEQILTAALQVFSRLGFDRATIPDIAGEAGIAVGTIYNYYESKRDLLIAITNKYVIEPFADFIKRGSNEDDAAFCQWAHGIGLTQYEAPTFARIWSLDYPLELQEGMTIAMETQWPTGEITGAYPHGQNLRIEEEVLVTKNGYELLTRWPIEELMECWIPYK